MKKSKIIGKLQGTDWDSEVIAKIGGKIYGIGEIFQKSWIGMNNECHEALVMDLHETDGSECVLTDEDFICRTNGNLKEEERICTSEAVEAKRQFDSDLFDLERTNTKCLQMYNKFRYEVMVDLFGSSMPLEERTVEDLEYYIYENNWEDEFYGYANPTTPINHTMELLTFLYRKVEGEVKRRLQAMQSEENSKQFSKELIETTRTKVTNLVEEFINGLKELSNTNQQENAKEEED